MKGCYTMKAKRILLLATLLVVLVGVASASEVSDETISADDSGINEVVAQDTTPATTTLQESISKEVKESKEITKESKNTKTASKTYDVNDFNTLHTALTSYEYDTISINIKSDITLTDDTILEENIKSLTINGNGKTINGNDTYQFLRINTDSNITIKNIKITNCNSINGSAIYSRGNLTITNSTLNNNYASDDGGAIYDYKGTLTITNSTLNNNRANDDGGTIYCFGTDLIIRNSTLENNKAKWYGGAICFLSDTRWFTTTHYAGGIPIGQTSTLVSRFGSFESTNNKYVNNLAGNGTTRSLGGAIYNIYSNESSIKNDLFDNNSAVRGGVIYNTGTGEISLTNSTFANNTAEEFGGAILNNNGTLSITKSILNNNYADLYGGAIRHYDGWLNITNSILNNNYAAELGGAIINEANLLITNSTINDNYANDSGGAIFNFGDNLTITECTLNSNIANHSGGAIYNGENLTITDSTINNNTANSEGGSISNEGNLIIYNCSLNNNKVTKEEGVGGAISSDTNITLKNSILINNKADYGGAINLGMGNGLITGNYFENNSAINGAAINNFAKLNITNNTFEINLATNKTETGIVNKGSNVIIKDNINDDKTPFKNTVYNSVNDTNITNNIFGNIRNTLITINTSNSTPIITNNITITATLTDEHGTKLANQKITLTIGNKTYNLTTNSNGEITQKYTTDNIGKQNITAKYSGTNQYNATSTTTSITVQDKVSTKITLTASNSTPIVNHTITITATLTDKDNKKLSNQNVTLNIAGKTYNLKTNANGVVTQSYTPTKVESQTITATYKGNNQYNTSTSSIKVTVKNKINTKTTATATNGIIGEKLTLKATVTDTANNKISEGNLIFKLNGVTIKDNGKLTGSSNPLRAKVTNGVATATITADLEMRNANKLTAHYIGTDMYNASASSAVKIQISQRNASIVVSSNVKTIKQRQVLTLTAKIYDTTNGKKSTNLTAHNDQFVYFKVNGITLKDSKGQMLKVKVVNGVASVNYTIPLGLSGVTDGKTMTPKNHTILAGFYNKNYQEDIRNTSTFQVERSNITITIANATVNNKTHKLSLTATIKDYLGNIVKGPNKCVIKINGVSLKNGTQPLYYYSTDGILNIKNINIPSYNKYTTIEIVTQDRLAYKSQRNTTKTIKVVN